MKRTIMLFAVVLLLAFYACKKNDAPKPAGKYPADVANAWMQMHIRLTRSTAGYNSVVSDRSLGYAGITMYETLAAGIPGGRSLLAQIGGTAISATMQCDDYYWPASVNAAMASITRNFFETTSAANMASVDSLEAAYTAKFQQEASSTAIEHAIDYGHQVATAIFEWSKTDGAHQAYSHIVDPTYIAPTGPGLWVPTFPAFGPPVHPHWGNINFEIIFTTSYDQYAIKAIRFSALDYLLKPVYREELQQAVQKTAQRNKHPLPQQLDMLLEKLKHPSVPVSKIAIPTMEGFQLLTADCIINCESEGNYTCLFLKDKRKIVASRNLKEMEEILEDYPFIRIHHSNIVKLNEVDKYIRGEGGYLIMSDGSSINVSRSRKELLLKKLSLK